MVSTSLLRLSLNMAEKSEATLLFRLVVLIIYISLGSLLFSHIEIKRSSREELNDKIARGISVLLRQHSGAVNLSEAKLKAFVWQIFEQMNVESDERWQFRDGFTFSFELLTTIGKYTESVLDFAAVYVPLSFSLIADMSMKGKVCCQWN